MDRKATAKETLDIMKQGYYLLQEPLCEPCNQIYGAKNAPFIRNHCVIPDKAILPEGKKVEIQQDMEHSIKQSILITPEEGRQILQKYQEILANRKKQTDEMKNTAARNSKPFSVIVENISTVDAIRKLVAQGCDSIGVLNFASAKNPGGGFINGAMAQEESLAASSTLYRTLTVHEEYYRANRACRSMIYTDHGIYSPDVLFFRDGSFRLANPVKASVLTLPAVNMGQVIQKGEEIEKAKKAMRRRMQLALAIFAEQHAKNLVLGAYGCGVFRNDPAEIATWWKELLEEGMEDSFDLVFHAVLDRSKGQNCFKAFCRFPDKRNQTCFSS